MTPDCTTCRITAKDYSERSDIWECARLECPMRRACSDTTTAPHNSEPAGGGYRIAPSNKE